MVRENRYQPASDLVGHLIGRTGTQHARPDLHIEVTGRFAGDGDPSVRRSADGTDRGDAGKVTLVSGHDAVPPQPSAGNVSA
jgi:hypothetical protein